MAAWQNFLDNFSGQAEFQAQKRGEQIQAEIDYYNTPEGQRAAQIGGGIMAAMLPIPGSRFFGASRVAKPVIDKAYGAVGKDMSRMIIPPLTKTGRQLTTKRGPRGPINVEQPTQLPLPLRGGRNTGGVSETDRAMIDFIKPKGIMNSPPAKSQLERLIIPPLTKTGRQLTNMRKVGAAKRTEQLANRQKFLEDAIRLNRSKIAANEAPSKDYNRLLEEYSRLIESLK